MKLKNNFKIREIAGEKVIVIQGQQGADMTKVITLNDSSEYLLNSLRDKIFTINDIVDLLTQEYDVDRQTAENDSKEWAKDLVESGLAEE